MAIGSDAPLGELFVTGLDGWDIEAWRAYVGEDLLGGYASLHYPPGREAPKPKEAS